MWNKLTNWISLLTVIFTAVKAYLENNSGNINYYELAIGIFIAVLSYLSGKSFNPDNGKIIK